MKDVLSNVNLETAAMPFPVRGVYIGARKRALDITLAIVILPAIIPILILLWAITRLDGAPGFYGQDRVGLDGRRFKCWKLRTMVVDAEQVLQGLCSENPDIAAEWNTHQKLSYDPRITWIGRFLRATSLDELPQIWNVLRGDMSFVGPRPFTTDQEELYIAAGGRAYFKMRPGISGPWQVEGRNETTFLGRIKYDNRYYEQVSLGYDLALLFKTVVVVLKSTGR
ncbi:sugar transferase [Parasulfitobacter algicola]|uniref:Sugar transferase n=1 Tax=Parasulfitobacter algicola TaxID=2614809 RepID=A0ABX2ILV9_9RHOB|nr:sugar transferase [Sulfitobacter algicola]NSX53864.1 sugar transferase [Sulfitobacter algicola]